MHKGSQFRWNNDKLLALFYIKSYSIKKIWIIFPSISLLSLNRIFNKFQNLFLTIYNFVTHIIARQGIVVSIHSDARPHISCTKELYRYKSLFIGLIMEMEQKIAIFDAFKPFLRILSVLNARNFQNQQHRFKNICLAIACFIFLINLFISIMAAICHCIALKFDLGQIALPFALLINSVQMLITYISIEIKNKQIEEMIAGLVETIHKRKPCFELPFSVYFRCIQYLCDIFDWLRLPAILCNKVQLWKIRKKVCSHCFTHHYFLYYG